MPLRPIFARKFERIDAIARPQGSVAMRLQKIVEELHIELVVFNNQDGFGHPRFLPRSPGANSPIGKNH